MADFLKRLDEVILESREELVETLSEFVRIPSVKGDAAEGAPFGEEIRRALDYFLGRCREFGLNTVDGDGYYGFADYGTEEKLLGVFGHLDVVPAGNNWSVEPFSGEIVDGKMISRGTMDDKGAIVSALFAIRALSKLGYEPKRTVRLFFGCDEESGFSCIHSYLQKERVPEASIVVDGNFPVTYYEKGIFRFAFQYQLEEDSDDRISLLMLDGGEKLNIVAGEAKAVLKVPEHLGKHLEEVHKEWLKKHGENSIKLTINKFGTALVHATGKKAHSSVAEQGLSAIALLLHFLAQLNIQGRTFFKFFSERVGLDVHGEGLGINAYDEESGHLTVNPGKVMMEDGTILLQFDVRYPVTTSGSEMESVLNRSLQGTSIKLCQVEDSAPMRTSPDGFLVRTLMNTYEDMTGIKVKPASMGGNTYAHVLPEAAAFGPNHPGKKKMAHMSDEAVPLDDLVLNTRIYARAIYELTQNLK